MTLYILFFGLIGCLWIWVTIRGKDAFPFSAYPMFSARHRLEDVRVIRIALALETGEKVWWQSEFYRYPEFVGRQLKQLYDQSHKQPKEAIFFQLKKKQLLIEVKRLIDLEIPADKSYGALHIIERCITADFKIEEKTVEVIPISSLKSE
jgi:hypothetical protein